MICQPLVRLGNRQIGHLPLPSPSQMPSFVSPRPFFARPPRHHSHFKCTQTPPQASPNPPSSPSRSPPPRLYTPTDLVRFQRSPLLAHLTLLSRLNCNPHPTDPPTRLSRALIHAGLAHESRVLSHLSALISTTFNIPNPLSTVPPTGDPHFHTLNLLRQRTPLLTNARLRNKWLGGAPDALLHSQYDPYATHATDSYVVCEVKMAGECTADHALQAAAYAYLLEQNGFRVASHAYLFLKDAEQPPVTLSLRPLRFLFRRVVEDVKSLEDKFDVNAQLPLPEGDLERLTPWKQVAKSILEERDSLRLVAGIRGKQIDEIQKGLDVTTLTEFAEVQEEMVEQVGRKRGWGSAYRKLHLQARLQLRSRSEGSAYEIVGDEGVYEEGKGDVYFDMEGFPWYDEGGLEYLFGAFSGDEFRYWWAHDRKEEEEAFIGFVEWIWEKFGGGGRIYHYGDYEIVALKRVGRRVKSLRGVRAVSLMKKMEGGFVDVYRVVREGVVIGEGGYSIKDVEKVVGVDRGGGVKDAESSVGVYYEWRRACFVDGESEEEHPALREILKYNQQDCESLKRVVRWCREKLPIRRPEGRVGDNVDHGEVREGGQGDVKEGIEPGACGRTKELKKADSDAIRQSVELSEQLLSTSHNDLDQDVCALLAHLLHFYVRESLPARASFSDRVRAATKDFTKLFEDEQCIAGVRLSERREDGRFVYKFNSAQPCVLRGGDAVAFVLSGGGGDAGESGVHCFMTVKAMRMAARQGEIVLGVRKDVEPPEFGVLVCSEELKICDAPLRQSVLRMVNKVMTGVHEESAALAMAFLKRKRIDEEDRGHDVPSFTKRELLGRDVAAFLVSRKEAGVFVVQGPPGSGKTFLAGDVISELVMQHGQTVAVSSNSHSAIDNLLSSAVRAGVENQHVCKVGTRSTREDVKGFKSNIDGLNVVSVHEDDESQRKRVALVGATCYQLAREEAEGRFDFLFVDEASQVPISNFVAMAACARYAVLCGDQQQLEMPIQGAHPDALALSCLSYMVGEGILTVGMERGVFLKESFRMGKEISRFVSDAFYGSALVAARNCEHNCVRIGDDAQLLTKGAGIQFVPVDKGPRGGDWEKGNTRYGKWHRPAEVAAIIAVVKELLGSTCSVNSNIRTIGVDDILVVAPFNAQVRALRERLPDGVRVGTVDKFQGQEAPVALVSTCTSIVHGDEVDVESWLGEVWGERLAESDVLSRREHRNLRFALKQNRLNVALSRAQCLAVVTGDAKALGKIPLHDLNDIDIASLYEQIVRLGSTGGLS